MKKTRKMITVYSSIWLAYLKAVKRKAEHLGDPTLGISSDLSSYMKSEAEKWK